jgi:HD superfamily phosphohydrolase YqeK
MMRFPVHEFWAHSPNPAAAVPAHLLKAHLRDVSWRAVRNAQAFKVPNVQALLPVAGLLHDLGKYKLEFQRERLGYDPGTGKQIPTRGKRVDHSSLEAVMNCPDLQT